MRLSLTILLLVSSLVACGKPKKEETGAVAKYGLSAEELRAPVATIGDRVITAGDFADHLAEQSPYLRARYENIERRRELLENMVRFELFAIEAEREGYLERPEIRRVENHLLIEALLDDEIDQKIQALNFAEEELRAYYDANREDYVQPEQVRASHILLGDERSARALLNELLKHGEGDIEHFREAASTRSLDEETKARYGDLRFFSRPGERNGEGEKIPPELARAAFEIREIGALYPQPVKTERGYHLIKLTAKRPALQRSFEEVRALIEARFRRERRQEAIRAFIEELKEKRLGDAGTENAGEDGKAEIEINVALLERLAHGETGAREEAKRGADASEKERDEARQ